jgi:thiol-disulfide isomerase/thioredoxin
VRRLPLVALLAVAACTGASTPSPAPAAGVVDAARAPTVPDVARAASWIGTPPLSRAALKGTVTWVDFWDASCINCRRTFPAMRRLYATYKPSGFTIVGVHSPEFDFEKDPAYVQAAAGRLGVTWPVANDPEMVVWKAFGNQYWPAQYLVDRNGKVRFTHIGEGDDDKLETVIRQLLVEGSSTALPAPLARPTVTTDAAGRITPERYLGAERGGPTIDAGIVPIGKTWPRNDSTPAPANLVALTGRFTGAAQYVEGAPGSRLALTFDAREVYAVLEPAGASSEVEVLLDGAPVPADQRGPDLTVTAAGKTVVRVVREDLWRLLTGPTADGGGNRSGVLTLVPRSAALRVYTFTFGA